MRAVADGLGGKRGLWARGRTRELTKEEIQLAKPTATPVVLKLSDVIVAGGALSDNTVLAVNAAAKATKMNGHL